MARVLVAYRGIPASPGWATGDSVCRALRRLGHEAIACGTYFGTGQPLGPASGDEPDLVLQLECNDSDPQYEISASCPRVYWEFDTSMHLEWSRSWCARFDRVYLANHAIVTSGEIYGAQYLPYAVDPYLFHARRREPKSGAACIGTAFVQRADFLKAAGVELISGIYRDEYVSRLASLQVGVHYYASGGYGLIVCRPWETMAVGTCLLAEDDPTLRLHFIPWLHYAPFSDADDCRRKAQMLLREDDLREGIARAGKAEMLAAHTYDHRVKRILSDMGIK